MGQQDFGARSTKMFPSTIAHPKLKWYDPTSIKLFLRLYDQCHREVMQRVKQLTGCSTITDESISPVQLMY